MTKEKSREERITEVSNIDPEKREVPIQELIDEMRDKQLNLAFSDSYFLHTDKLGLEGVKVLAQILPEIKIYTLDLDRQNIGDEGAKILAEALLNNSYKTKIKDLADGMHFHFTAIRELGITGDNIGAVGAKAIVEALSKISISANPFKNLSINLNGNKIGDEGARAIAEVLSGTKIHSILLRKNNIGSVGAKAIAEKLPGTDIEIFSLSDNNIGDEGAKAIARALPDTQIETLYLENSKIGDQGAEAIVDVISNTRVIRLDLGKNNIKDDVAEKLGKKLFSTLITEACLLQNERSLDLQKNKAKVQEIIRLFKEHVHVNKYSSQEESKQGDQINTLSNTSSKMEFGKTPFGGIIRITELVQDILLQPKAAKIYITDAFSCHNKASRDYKEKQISDFIDNIIPNFVSVLGEDVVSRVKSLKGLYELVEKNKLNEDFFKQILKHSGDKFDVAKDIMHPFVYKLMHKFGMPSSINTIKAQLLIDTFSKINKESKELISDEDLEEFNLFSSKLKSAEEEEVKKMLDKPEFHSVVKAQTDELSEQIQEEQIDQAQVDHSQIDQSQVQNVVGENSSLFE